MNIERPNPNFKLRIKSFEELMFLFFLCCPGIFPTSIFSQDIRPASTPVPEEVQRDDYQQRRARIAALKYFSRLASEIPDAPASLTAQESETVEKLVILIGDGDFKIREEATRELVRMGPSIKAKILAAAKSKDPETSFRARKVLAKIKETEDVKPRMKVESYIFCNHVNSYIRAQDKLLVPMLIDLLGHPDQQVRDLSWRFLKNLTEQQFNLDEVKRWREWWNANSGDFKMKPAVPGQIAPFNGPAFNGPINNMIIIEQ